MAVEFIGTGRQEDTPEGHLMAHLRDAFAEREARTIATRCQLGREGVDRSRAVRRPYYNVHGQSRLVMKAAAVLMLCLFLGLAASAAAQGPAEPGPERGEEGREGKGQRDGVQDGGNATANATANATWLSVTADGLKVAPGRTANTTVVAHNPNHTADVVAVAVREAPPGWRVALEDSRLDVPAEGSAETVVAVTAGGREGTVVLAWRAHSGANGTLAFAVAVASPPGPCEAPGDRARADARCPGVDGEAAPDAAAEACFAALRGRAGDAAWRADVEACCKEHGGTRVGHQRCAALLKALDRAKPVHASFEATADGFVNHTVQGLRTLDHVRHQPGNASAEIDAEQRTGRWFAFSYSDGSRLVVHDNPTGLVQTTGNGTVEARFAAGAVLVPTDDGWQVRGPGWRGILWMEEGSVDGRDVHAVGGFTFHMMPATTRTATPEARDPGSLRGTDPDLGPPPTDRDEVREKVQESLERRQVGAEVSLRRGAPDAEGVRVLTYDDMEVDVRLPVDRATREDPILVEVSAKLPEGRTIVLDVDPDLVGAGELELRYFNVIYRDGVRHEAEVVFERAASLADVLEPNEGLQPKWWVVEDQEGIHVLVSIPHWSIHAITISGIVDAVLQPSVLIGAAAGVTGTFLAAALLLWPRRRGEPT